MADHVVMYMHTDSGSALTNYDVPLYPAHNYPLYESTANNDRIKLKNVTWCLGDKPCKTLRKAAGAWVDVTN